MDLLSPLLISVGSAGAKFLAKKWMGAAATSTGLIDGEVAGELAGAVIDCFKDKIKDVREQRKAARLFEEIGDKIADRLRPTFEQAIKSGQVNVSDVTVELVSTLEARVSAEFFVQADLDPARLTSALRAARPVERGTFSAGELAFYDQALEEAVRYLVSTASTLPRFQESFATESLKRLSHLEGDLKIVLETTQRLEHHVIGSHPSDVANFEVNYRLAVIAKLDRVELFGAEIPDEAQRNVLTEAFVPLTVQRSTGKGKTEPELVSSYDVFDQLQPGKGRLLIRGAAGTGKTTLLRWAAIHAAACTEKFVAKRSGFIGHPDAPSEDPHEYAESKRPTWQTRIPFLILLRHCPEGRLPKPEAFAEAIAQEIGAPPVKWVESLLQEGRGLVLIDGVDEVPEELRPKVRDEVEAIANFYPENFFVITTRPTSVPEDWLSRLNFREAEVSAMSSAGVVRFVRKWHDAVAQELGRRGRPATELPQTADDLIELLEQDAALFRLATNPLLCAMICALHRGTRQKLPEGQRALCEALCKMLLHERERQSGLDWRQSTPAYGSLSYEQKRRIVQELAQFMMLEGKSAISVATGAPLVAKILDDIPGRTADEAELVLKGLMERSGMLREPNSDELDFLHNTFKEFLAAEFFAHNGHVEMLVVKGLVDESWRRVALFAVATDDVKFASGMVRRILEDPILAAGKTQGKAKGKGKENRELRARTADLVRSVKLFAVQCRAVVTYLKPDLFRQLEGLLSEVFPPQTFGEAEALAVLGDVVVPYLERRKGVKVAQAAACVRALRLIKSRKAKKLLLDYVEDKRWGVACELAQALNPLLIPAVRHRIQGSGEVSQQIRSQICDLKPLAGLSGLTSLDLDSTQVSDLSPLAGLSGLTSLGLSLTPVSDLSPLAGLSGLTSLGLSLTQVSDLSPLAGLSGLTSLYLWNTPVSDLSPLAGLTKLSLVRVTRTLNLTIPESLRGVVHGL